MFGGGTRKKSRGSLKKRGENGAVDYQCAPELANDWLEAAVTVKLQSQSFKAVVDKVH